MRQAHHTALVIDDDRSCREYLAHQIDVYCPQVRILDCLSSVAEARQYLASQVADAVFLDIEMPEENGFHLMEMVRPLQIPTIFTTAHEHYALRAIKHMALDYLLKPIEPSELIAAVSKLTKPQSDFLKKSYTKILLPTRAGYQFCLPEEMMYCVADGAYTKVVLQENDLLVSRNIGQLEKELRAFSFFRIHKSYLVNLLHVQAYIRGNGGQVVMSDGMELDVSKRKREDFLQAVSRY
ncbi:MAG: LytTR family DNA-binding domain-containing protein [Bacteroidota bacterium]